MLNIRRSDQRGSADYGWLKTFHSFSFGDYIDPQNMRYRSLRVMNEDWIAAGKGFGTHPHRDMEIVTYVLEGALEHQDSMGNGSVLRPGEFQRMTAGSGITHSEFNPSSDAAVHLYQIWLLPESRGLEPSYEQKHFDPADRDGGLQLVASRDGRDGSLKIHQDAAIYLANLNNHQTATHLIAPTRAAWIQVLRGDMFINGTLLKAGDGLAAEGVDELELTSPTAGEIMLFDLQ